MGATVSLRSLWFGLVGAPLAWSVGELGGYALSAQGCEAGRRTAVVLAIATTLVGLAAGVTAYRAWRASDPRQAPAGFMAFGGILTSVLFVLLLAMNLALAAVMPACA
jgi:LytS/YehU family sensor histidine kinase